MKRKRILTQYLLYFLMLMFLLVAGCSSGDDDNDDDTTTPTIDYWVTVSGTVTTAGGTPLSGVVMSAMVNLEVMNIDLLNISYGSDQFSLVITGTDGTYSLTVPAALVENYTLVITPAKKGYTFTPRVLTIAQADQPGINFTAVAKDEFSQSDLTGYWRVKILKSGTENQWIRYRVRVSASGGATCWSYETSAAPGVTACPATFEESFAMGSGDNEGVITHTVGSNTNHITMNSNKNFMAGTGTSGTSYQLIVAQKDDVPGGTASSHYIGTELNSRPFVFHSLRVGGTNEWRYGNGATTSTGVIDMTGGSESTPTAPLGTAPLTLDSYRLAVDANGIVTMTLGSVPTNFEGFLSIDERTIVGTFTEAGGDPQLIVIQLNAGQTITTMTGSSVNHLLAVADNLTPLWAYHDINISRLDMTLLPDFLELEFGLNAMLCYDWNLSLPYNPMQKLGLIKIRKINIADNGAATIEDPASTTDPSALLFHGQLAFDGTFMVGVETLTLTEGTFYALDVITH